MIVDNGLLYKDNSFETCIGLAQKLEEITFNANTKRITGKDFQNCDIKKIILPDNIKIDDQTFGYNRTLEELIIENKNVARCAFVWCGTKVINGTVVKMENTINIDSYAFKFSRINEIIFPDTLKKIGMCAFYGAYFIKDSLKLLSNLERIESGAFAKTNITNLYLPDSITYWGNLSENNEITLHMSRDKYF